MAERIVDGPVPTGPAGQEEWAALVGRSHRGWRLHGTGSDAAGAMRTYPLGELTVVGCRAPACAGVRRADRESDHHDGSELALLILHTGREHVTWRDRTVTIGAGEALVWDTRADGRFVVDQFVDKSTLFLPRAVVASWFPRLAEVLERGPISAADTLALRSLLRAIDLTPESVLTGQSDRALAGALTELTFVALGGAAGRSGPSSTGLWRQMTRLVEDRLPDQIDAHTLARELCVSVRLVYRTFADNGTTVRRYVKLRRVTRARDELADTRRRRSIGGTAQRWGFADQSAFTKAFREEFGTTPRAFIRRSAG